jgi:hypothetical protein
MDRAELERLDREGLVTRAQAAGIRRARLLTRPELIDELLRLDAAVDPAALKKSRGFFGIARDLLTRVVERGLHLPDAADRLRVAFGSNLPQVPRPEPQAVPTVTLAEIYAAQGHKQRAIETLERVLEAEPEHAAARALLEKLEEPTYVVPPAPLPPEDEAGGDVGAEAAAREEPPSSSSAVTEEPRTLVRGTRPTECVAIPLSQGRTYVWWSLARPLPAGASFVVRAVVLTPTWEGPRRDTRDVPCDADAGELLLGDLPEGAVVRVAIGTLEGGELVPLAHSPAIERSAHGLVEWTLEGRAPAIARSVTRAAELARRHVDA